MYCCGWRDASEPIVVIPVSVSAAGMFGFSTPECSPVTIAAGV